MTPVGRHLAAFALSLLAVTAGAQSWSFDSDAEGWQIAEVNALTLSQVGASVPALFGGDYIFANSQSTDDPIYTFFQAPAFDASALLGGTLKFSLSTPNGLNQNAVVLYGNGIVALAPVDIPASGSWSDYSLVLDAANFFADPLFTTPVSTTDFAGIMANLDALLIPADFGGGGTASTATNLDNVSVTAIPEPSTVAVLFGGAALALVAIRRRMRR